MASFLHAQSRLGTVHCRAPARLLRKLAPPAKLVTSRIAVPSPAATVATAVVEAPTADSAKCRPALYLLHRHLPRSTHMQDGGVSQEQLRQLHDDLRAMEKVAKRAAWFSAIEATDGEHVLLLTDCAKLGRKYGLQAMPGNAGSFTVDLPGRSVEVPLADVAAALAAQRVTEASADDSDEEDEKKVTDKAAKKQRKEEEKAAKALAKAEAKAARIVAGMGEDGKDDSEDESDDEEDGGKKVKAEKKKDEEEKKEKEKKDKEKAAALKIKEEESDEESVSESGSESEGEEEKGWVKAGAKGKEGAAQEGKVKVQKMEDGSDSEDDEEESGSESSDEEEDAMAGMKAAMSMDSGSGSESEEESSGSESESEEGMDAGPAAKTEVKTVAVGDIPQLEA